MADLLGQDLLQATTNTAAHAANTVAQTKQAVMQAAVTCPPLEGVSYMNSIIAVAVAAVVMGIVGYFVGKHGLTKTQTDLTNVIKDLQAQTSNLTTAVHDTAKKLP